MGARCGSTRDRDPCGAPRDIGSRASSSSPVLEHGGCGVRNPLSDARHRDGAIIARPWPSRSPLGPRSPAKPGPPCGGGQTACRAPAAAVHLAMRRRSQTARHPPRVCRLHECRQARPMISGPENPSRSANTAPPMATGADARCRAQMNGRSRSMRLPGGTHDRCEALRTRRGRPCGPAYIAFMKTKTPIPMAGPANVASTSITKDFATITRPRSTQPFPHVTGSMPSPDRHATPTGTPYFPGRREIILHRMNA